MAEADIKPEDIVSKLDPSTSNVEESAIDWFSVLQKGSEKTESMGEKENQGILERREKWSTWVLIFIGAIVIFDIILVTFYGLGIWSFTDPNVVIAVVTDNFLKIFGLGFLITRESFKKIYHIKS